MNEQNETEVQVKALERVQTALRDAGHGAEWVQSSPIPLLNIFPHDEGRYPAVTLMFDTKDGYLWGKNWGLSAPGTTPAENIANQVLETARENA